MMIFFSYEDYCRYKSYFYNSYFCIKEDDTTPDYIVYSTVNDKIKYNPSIKDVHDKLYKDFLNDPIEFSQYLKYFFNIDIFYTELIPYSNEFITHDYKSKRSDVVYKLKDSNVYIFLEHQSTIDHSISYRIFEYYHLILNATIDISNIKNKAYEFPVIIPILLYTGDKKWNLSPNFKNRKLDNLYTKDILNFSYEYINIFNYSIEQLLNMDCMIAYLLAIDKCKLRSEVLDVLEKLTNIVNDSTKKYKIRRLILYIYKDFFDDRICSNLLEKFDEGDDLFMKYAWDYVREDIAREREKNRREGRQQGRKEGIVEGIQKTIYEIIRKMLENGESIDKIKLYSGYSKSKIEKIRKELLLNYK